MESATARQEDDLLTKIAEAVHERVVGQDHAVEGLLVGLLTGGHVLLEGLPGLAKTLMVRTLAEAIQTGFRRIQFTPDLLPTDIVGTPVFDQGTGDFRVHKGPIFSNIILAGRDQPCTSQGASCLVRSDGRAAGHNRGRDTLAGLPVHGASDSEPGRTARNISAS